MSNMNITYFIGNGFDLNIGLKTSYSDFYGDFSKNASPENIILQWYNEDDPNENLWADLEMSLGNHLASLQECDVERFYKDKNELDVKLSEYLEKQESQISTDGIEKEIAAEMVRTLTDFHDSLPEKEKEVVIDLFSNHSSDTFKYNFVTFNYTDVLDQFVNITKKQSLPINTLWHWMCKNGVRKKAHDAFGKIIHIHGLLRSEMILGVNDSEQINNVFLRKDEAFLDTFVKPRMNEVIGQKKTEAVKELLNSSRVVCVYGMSMGDTDKMWWQELASWLRHNKNNLLILYCIKKGDANSGVISSSRNTAPEIIHFRKDKIDKFLQYSGITQDSSCYNELCKRIFVCVNAKMFDFEDIVLKNKQQLL